MTDTPLPGEDGYRLWLRYQPITDAKARRAIERHIRLIVTADHPISPTLRAAAEEILRACRGMLNVTPPIRVGAFEDGAIVLQVRKPAPDDAGASSARAAADGFAIRSEDAPGGQIIRISADTDLGVLYGAFHLLRLMQMGESIEQLDIEQSPRLALRILDHWDNLDGSIERGYAGKSLWKWEHLPKKLSPRYVDYARALASIGTNGAVLNNVNANPLILSRSYLEKTAALADVLRPYGVRVYLSPNFASPMLLGDLATADPLDPRVIRWWKEKADEIYRLIPDFAGFLVKANSESQPGPADFGRTHADGANVLADALADHGGIVLWRAFVYDENVDPDRAMRAYIEFVALDGQFRPNVMVQVKNGPIDFQPREPFHPLFGAMKKTPLMAELQITQEYLGHSNHLVFLAPMWSEFLQSDTCARPPNATVAEIIEGKIYPQRLTGISAVSNIGDNINWCGHHFAQANLYAFGRLAWNPTLAPEAIANEWLRMTFTHDPRALEMLRRMMLDSWETFVSYSMPLGLHHLIGGDHYAPMPENNREPRADWTATYYHHAGRDGIGFDRTTAGSRAVEQYFGPLRERLNSPSSCPEKFLLWFHHLRWNYKLAGGRTLWDELQRLYTGGAARAAKMQADWQSLRWAIDARRHREIAAKLAIQSADAARWSQHCLRYFESKKNS